MTAGTVCFVSDEPDGAYLVNRLREEVGVALVVVVEPDSVRRRLARTFRSRGPGGLWDIAGERFDGMRRRHDRRAALDRWFGDRWHDLPEDVSRVVTHSGSDPAVLRAVAGLGDVDLVVHANVLVSDDLIAACRTALNVHWGLSPYYRGTYCTEWALLHADVRNIGVTVHELTRTIDGGRIVGQRRATLSAHDTVRSIDAQLTVLGTDVVRDSLRILADGGSLVTAPQDLSLGQLTLKRQWTRHQRRQVARLEHTGLASSIARPSRPELPIVDGPVRADAA